MGEMPYRETRLPTTRCPGCSSCKSCKARHQGELLTLPGVQPSWPRRPGEEAARACVQTALQAAQGPLHSDLARCGRVALLPTDLSLHVPISSEVTDDNNGQSPGMMLPSSPCESGNRSGGMTSSLIQASSSPSVFGNSLASKSLMGLPQTKASSRFPKRPLAFLLWVHSHKPLHHDTIW